MVSKPDFLNLRDTPANRSSTGARDLHTPVMDSPVMDSFSHNGPATTFPDIYNPPKQH
jgi:hypothetical protein